MSVVNPNSSKARILALALGSLLTLISANTNAEKRSIEAAILAKSTTDWRGAKLPSYGSRQSATPHRKRRYAYRSSG